MLPRFHRGAAPATTSTRTMWTLTLLAATTAVALAQNFTPPTLNSSFPHAYPGLPNTNGNFSDSAAWQKYFEVTKPLPNITFSLTRSFAGNIPVNRPNHPNNTLFFWAYEKSNGSLTNASSKDPWVLWLNGGPGSSSLLGLTLENGPIHFNPDFSAIKNNFSWSTAADVLWVDQPVGVGWSTSDKDAFVPDEDQMGLDFMGFLSNLAQVFPGLAKRPLYLTGESYAGVYIPYITKTYFNTPKPPVNLVKIAMGDGLYGDGMPDIMSPVPIVLQTYPQLIGYDPEVLQYFQEQHHLCHYDVNLTYPQNGIIPAIVPPASTIVGQPNSPPGAVEAMALQRTSGDFGRRMGSEQRKKMLKRVVGHVEEARAVERRGLEGREEIAARRAVLKRDLTGRANGTIDPWYGCDLFDEMLDYALNFSAPWKGHDGNGFDVYFIPDALDPEAPPTPDSVGVFLNDPRVMEAIHAPTSKSWTSTFTLQAGYPFGGGFKGDPSTPPMNFFSELASNLSAHGMPWVFMSGNADSLLPHTGTEIIIQNISFGGTQGFTQRPSTPFFDSKGNFAGKVHQERNLTFALFDGAGHLIPATAPDASLTFFKEFILGSNAQGSLLPNGTTVGGTNETLAESVMPAASAPIFFGTGTTQGTTVAPAATIAAWEGFIATGPGATSTSVAGGGKQSNSARLGWRVGVWEVMLSVGVGMLGAVAVVW